MKKVAIIQARMGSSRLPGKVLLRLGDKTVLNHVIDRVKTAGVEVVIATSDKPQDDAIEAEANRCGAGCFRGSENEVLSRYYYAAKEAGADLVVRITSDCPLYDGELLAKMLACRQDEDYLSNVIERTFPRGLDTEIFTFKALEKTFNEAQKDFEKEHVTPYIYQNPDKFHIRHYKGDEDNSGLRWTLDTPEDFTMIKAVYDELYQGEVFSSQKVLNLLKAKPEISELNAHIEQKKLA
jgi:spore coat polysaccharide biosynthesis protein SpsF